MGKKGGGGNMMMQYMMQQQQMEQARQQQKEMLDAMEKTRAEKPQSAKPVTEAATAARQSQKDKAAKASGIQGSILTTPMSGGLEGMQNGKTKLGQ